MYLLIEIYTPLHPQHSLEKAQWVLRFLVRFAVEDLVFRFVLLVPVFIVMGTQTRSMASY